MVHLCFSYFRPARDALRQKSASAWIEVTKIEVVEGQGFCFVLLFGVAGHDELMGASSVFQPPRAKEIVLHMSKTSLHRHHVD
jgi:hypothetical protein